MGFCLALAGHVHLGFTVFVLFGTVSHLINIHRDPATFSLLVSVWHCFLSLALCVSHLGVMALSVCNPHPGLILNFTCDYTGAVLYTFRLPFLCASACECLLRSLFLAMPFSLLCVLSVHDQCCPSRASLGEQNLNVLGCTHKKSSVCLLIG